LALSCESQNTIASAEKLHYANIPFWRLKRYYKFNVQTS
jgi:hypothetical protein